MVNVPYTFGALLVGGIVATLFSGVTQVQALVYVKLYPNDRLYLKCLVAIVWLLDTLHTVFITLSLWDHLILNFGDASNIDYVPWSLAMTIALTAVPTFVVHWFFIYRIYILSGRIWLIAAPLGLMACARLCFACLTTAKLIELRSLTRFVELYTWSFTSGLTLSASLDIFITALMCWVFQKNQNDNSSMNNLLDKLMLYTFENGALTTLAACLSLVTWLTMKWNLIFLATHFIISKFYANSLLATLNTRQGLKPGHRSQISASGAATTGSPVVVNYSDEYKKHRKGYSNDSHQCSPESQDISALQIKVHTATMMTADLEMNSLDSPVLPRS